MLYPGDLDKLLRAIVETRETEIGCEESFERMDHFAEMELSGLDAGAMMPLVRDHLSKCEDCRETFEALLRAVRATEIEGCGPYWASGLDPRATNLYSRSIGAMGQQITAPTYEKVRNRPAEWSTYTRTQ